MRCFIAIEYFEYSMLIQTCTKIADIFIVSQIFSWFTSFVFLFDITDPKMNQFTVFTRPWFNITYIFNSMDAWQASLHRQRYYTGALLWHTQRMSPWFSANRQQVISNTHTDFTMTVVPYQEYTITLHPLTHCDLVIQSSDTTSWINELKMLSRERGFVVICGFVFSEQAMTTKLAA